MCVLGDNEWCTTDAPCFSCEEHAHAVMHASRVVEDCPTCKMRSVILSHDATPSKPWRPQQMGTRGNEWEKGIPTDDRGMPWLKPGTVAPVGQKEYAQDRKKIESARRQLANA